MSDPDLWYYTAAFAEHLLGHNAEASRLLSKAERSKGSRYMKESIRVFRIYLDALGPYDNAYENKILNGVRWLEGKETQRYLNSKGYNNIDFFREVIGTRLIRQMKYAEATEWLSQVPTSFQSQLNTCREGYFQYDPFLPEKTAIKDNADYKYNFAREMASLEESISQTSDPGRKALLITRFATGIKNSLGNCWALSFYGLSVADIYTATRPTPFSIAQEAGFARADELSVAVVTPTPTTTSRIEIITGTPRTVTLVQPAANGSVRGVRRG